jgi:hypothetical protein
MQGIIQMALSLMSLIQGPNESGALNRSCHGDAMILTMDL